MNIVAIIGRLAADPEVKKSKSGLSVLSFRLGVERWAGKGKDKQADWINCVVWRQSADYLGQYAHKGSLVSVEGSIQTRSYEDKDGKTVYVTEVLADHVKILANAHEQHPAQPQQTQQQTYSQGFDDSFGNFDSPALDISSDDLPF